MYLVLPVPFRIAEGKTFVEAQAANGLDRWGDNIAHVLVAAPVIPETEVRNLAGFVWRDIATLEHHDRIECQPLPWAYTAGPFLKQYSATRTLIATSIARCQHLQFAIGGLIGDWAAIAALEAIRQNRRYAIHTDRVEHEVIRRTAASSSPLRKLRVAIEAPLLERYHRYIIRRCSLGLWHGDDCFRAYSPWGQENHLVHDIHTKESDLIEEEALKHKIKSIRNAETLNIVYAGRLDPMKAPLEWLAAMARSRDLGAKFTAVWYGEGALLDEVRSETKRLDLHGLVTFPGFVASRTQLMNYLRNAHALVFTHITPESPRILLEALVTGTPILGYNNGYAADLLRDNGGGALVPTHDTQALGSLIASHASHRSRLAEMAQQAASSSRRFTDANVFAERSALIKRYA